MTRSNLLTPLILATFSTFLVVFIVSLCVNRSSERLDACGLHATRIAAIAEPLHTVEAIRIAFADRAYCPPRSK